MLKNRKSVLYISWVVVFIWMIVIYSFSAQPAYKSGHLSKGIAKEVVETVEKVAPQKEINLDWADHIVRKNAHFFNYLVLGIFVMNALRQSGISRKKIFVFALSICVLYASSDEIHQIFVPGRGAMVRDVFIDSAGASLGIVLFVVFFKFIGGNIASIHRR